MRDEADDYLPALQYPIATISISAMKAGFEIQGSAMSGGLTGGIALQGMISCFLKHLIMVIPDCNHALAHDFLIEIDNSLT